MTSGARPDTKAREERSKRIGTRVILLVFLVVATVYLVTTIQDVRDPIVSLYPALCGGALLILVVVDLVASFVSTRRRRIPAATPMDDIAAARNSDGDAPDESDAVAEVLAAEESSSTSWRVFLPLLIGTCVFALVVTQVDYLIATVVYMFAAIWFLDRKKFTWWSALILALATAAAVHLLFVVVLGLRLPTLIPGL